MSTACRTIARPKANIVGLTSAGPVKTAGDANTHWIQILEARVSCMVHPRPMGSKRSDIAKAMHVARAEAAKSVGTLKHKAACMIKQIHCT